LLVFTERQIGLVAFFADAEQRCAARRRLKKLTAAFYKKKKKEKERKDKEPSGLHDATGGSMQHPFSVCRMHAPRDAEEGAPV